MCQSRTCSRVLRRRPLRIAWAIILSVSGVLPWSARPASAQPVCPDPIPLGMISPLSGDWSEYGQHIRRGIELAAADLDRQGIHVKVYYEDACLPARAVSAVTKLIKVDGIRGLVGSYCVIGMAAAAPIVERNHIVAFHTSPVPAELLDGGDFVLSTNIRIVDEAVKLADYAYNDLHAQRAAVLSLSTQWGQEYARAFIERFKALGGKIVAGEETLIEVNEFRSELTRIKAAAPQVLLAVHVGANLGNALKQARQLGLSQPILSVNEAEEASVLQVAGDSVEGLRFFAPEPAVESMAMAKFAREYEQAYHHPPHTLSRHAYDATMLTANALKACGCDEACARSRLYRISAYPGVSGDFSIGANGGTKREFVLKTVKDGKFQRVK